MLWIRGIGNFKNIQNSVDVILVLYKKFKKLCKFLNIIGIKLYRRL